MPLFSVLHRHSSTSRRTNRANRGRRRLNDQAGERDIQTASASGSAFPFEKILEKMMTTGLCSDDIPRQQGEGGVFRIRWQLLCSIHISIGRRQSRDWNRRRRQHEDGMCNRAASDRRASPLISLSLHLNSPRLK